MLYTTTFIFICVFRVELHLYIIYCRKAFAQYCDIQITIYYEMDRIYHVNIFIYLFEYIVGYVHKVYLKIHNIKSDPWYSLIARPTSKGKVVGFNSTADKNFVILSFFAYVTARLSQYK